MVLRYPFPWLYLCMSIVDSESSQVVAKKVLQN